MRYKYCPQCKAMNREGDSSCYQCSKSFAEMETAPPIGGASTAPHSAQPTHATGSPLNLGEVLSQSIQLYLTSLQPTALLAILFSIGVFLCLIGMTLTTIFLHKIFALFWVALISALAPIYLATHTRLLLSIQRQENLPLSQILLTGIARGISLALTLLATFLIVAIAIFSATFLTSLAIPILTLPIVGAIALYLFLIWYLVVPCATLEDHIFTGALSRSAQLVRPQILSIIALVILGGLLGLAATYPPQYLGRLAMTAVLRDALLLNASKFALITTFIKALIPLSLSTLASAILGSITNVIIFQTYWKLTGGRSISNAL